jgi:hypothetical protein
VARNDPGPTDSDPDLPSEPDDDGDPLLVRPFIVPPAAIASDATHAELDNDSRTAGTPARSPLVPRQRRAELFFAPRDDLAVPAQRPVLPAADEPDAGGKPLYGRSPDSDWLHRRRRRHVTAAALTSVSPSGGSGGPPLDSHAAQAGVLAALWPMDARRRNRIIVVAAATALLLAIGFAGYRLQGRPTPDTGGLPEAFPSAAALPSPASVDPTGALPPPSPLPGGVGGPGASAGGGTDDSGPVATQPGGPAPTTPKTTVPPTTATAKPPTNPAVHVGEIRGVGGRCLDVIDGVEARGHRLQVLTCNGAVGQTWSLTSAGTLVAGGRCAQYTGSEAVKLVDCDGTAAGRWRVGTGSTLVNGSTGGCLTDPSAGIGNAIEVRLLACDGGAGQRWSLP